VHLLIDVYTSHQPIQGQNLTMIEWPLRVQQHSGNSVAPLGERVSYLFSIPETVALILLSTGTGFPQVLKLCSATDTTVSKA